MSCQSRVLSSHLISLTSRLVSSRMCNSTVHYSTVNEQYIRRARVQVARLAGVLARKCGVRAGDRVVIYMPLVPQAIMAMLACSRLGAVHSVVFGGFAAKELATRVQHAKVCPPSLTTHLTTTHLTSPSPLFACSYCSCRLSRARALRSTHTELTELNPPTTQLEHCSPLTIR